VSNSYTRAVLHCPVDTAISSTGEALLAKGFTVLLMHKMPALSPGFNQHEQLHPSKDEVGGSVFLLLDTVQIRMYPFDQ
jgi:hypothetical protein